MLSVFPTNQKRGVSLEGNFEIILYFILCEGAKIFNLISQENVIDWVGDFILNDKTWIEQKSNNDASRLNLRSLVQKQIALKCTMEIVRSLMNFPPSEVDLDCHEIVLEITHLGFKSNF